jgi:ubiquinone/menaquinone biosynthesis C-methylase UbiE
MKNLFNPFKYSSLFSKKNEYNCKIFEKVTEANFCQDNYLRANPDAVRAIEDKEFDNAYKHFFSVKNHSTRFQYCKKNVDLTSQIKLQGNCPTKLLDLIDEPLYPLSKQLGESYCDIYAPVNFMDMEKIGITSQFLEDSAIYHKNYFSTNWSKHLIQTALDNSNVQFLNPTIFDLGSGSGNSVFAFCELFSNCNIIATDLSPNLLKIMMHHKKEYYSSSRIEAIAMDALNVRIKPSRFDIFSGSAILHHLIDIDTIFQVAYLSLKSNGCAFFFEPMLSGFVVMTSLLRSLLKMNESVENISEKLSEKVIQFFKDLILNWTIRGNAINKMEHFNIAELDDKWLFTRQRIEAVAKKAGFYDVKIASLFNPPRYKSQLTGLLHFVEVNFIDLPKWAKEIVDIFDESDIMCNENDIFMEVAIICRK